MKAMSPSPPIQVDLRLIRDICDDEPEAIQEILERIRIEIENYVAFGRKLDGKVDRYHLRRVTHRLKSSLSYLQSPEMDECLADFLALLNQVDASDQAIRTRYQEVTSKLQKLTVLLMDAQR